MRLRMHAQAQYWKRSSSHKTALKWSIAILHYSGYRTCGYVLFRALVKYTIINNVMVHHHFLSYMFATIGQVCHKSARTGRKSHVANMHNIHKDAFLYY